LHVFPFSPRDGTVAAGLPNPVPQRIAGERSRELREMANDKGLAYKASRVGGPAEVIVEGESGTDLTGDYLRVGLIGLDRDSNGLSGPRYSGTLQGDKEHLYIELSHNLAVILG